MYSVMILSKCLKRHRGGETMDNEKLAEYVKKSAFSIGRQAEIMGMSRSCWYRKRKGISEFTVSEIEKCCCMFKMNNKAKHSIFFD